MTLQGEDIVTVIALNPNARIKNQSRDEPDLTVEEKKTILSRLLNEKPAIFLAKYHELLNNEHSAYFTNLMESNQNSAYEIEFYVNAIKDRSTDFSLQTRNRRYNAMEDMISEEHPFFSEEEMRQRQPLLYEQLVGQYLTEKEIHEQVAKSNQTGDMRLSTMFMQQMENMQSRLTEQLMEEYGDLNCENDSDSDDSIDECRSASREPITPAWKSHLKAEFLNHMKEKFISGKEMDFDYTTVDSNTKYDDFEAINRDAEEKYFNEDDDEQIATN